MINTNSRSRISLAVFCLLALVIILNRFLLPRFDTHNIFAIISWDVFGYYLYLPARFVHHDLGIRNFAWVQEILDTYHPTVSFYQAYAGPEGDFIMKYPMGMAILYSPFYFLGHVLAHILGYSPDGFTLPYQLSIAFGGLVYTVTGLWFMRKILLRYFTDGAVACTLVLIAAGTNYFQLTAFDGAMPHNYLFTLFAVIVWATIRWHESRRWKHALIAGLLCGLATIVRPTAIIIVLVPLLWEVWGIPGLRKKIALVRENYLHVMVFVAAMFLVNGMQLLYWKIHSGSWLYYSYEEGEKLKWLAPYILKVLFSYRKGWLVYAPLMTFAILGFIPLAVKYRPLFTAAFVFCLVHLLIVSSWPSWWYGGSFGQRAMMESYLLFSLPAAALFQWLLTRKNAFKWPAFTVMFLFVILNLFQTWQYMHWIFDPSQMSKKYYWSVFGKTSLTSPDILYLEPTDNIEERDVIQDSANYISKTVVMYDFEKDGQVEPEFLCKDTAHTGNRSMRLSKKIEFSPGLKMPYKDLSPKNFVWLRATAWVYFTCAPEEVNCGLVITCIRKGEAYKYRMLALEKEHLKPFTWNRVTLDYRTPFLENREDPVQAYFWCRGEQELLVDDFEIRLMEPKD